MSSQSEAEASSVNVNKRKDRHQFLQDSSADENPPVVGGSGDQTERDDEVRDLLDLKKELIETLKKHRDLLDGNKLPVATRRTMSNENKELIDRLEGIRSAPKRPDRPGLNENEVSAQLKALTRAVKSIQDDLNQVKRNVKQTAGPHSESHAAAASEEERLCVIEPGKKTYSEVVDGLKGCRLVEDKLQIDRVFSTKSNLVIAKTRSKADRDRLIANCQSAGLNARQAKGRLHRFVLKRLPPDTDNNELINELLARRKDTELLKTSFKVVKSFVGKNGLKVLIFNVDSDGAKAIDDDPDFFYGLGRHRAMRYANELQCFKCFGFDHLAANCQKAKVCGQCAGDHEEATEHCPEPPEVHVCVNCTREGLPGAETHVARSNLCPVKRDYRKRLIDRPV